MPDIQLPEDGQIVPALFVLMDALDQRERMLALQALAQRYLNDRTQVCGWCMTPYQHADQAAACARRCRQQADGPTAAPGERRCVGKMGLDNLPTAVCGRADQHGMHRY